MSPIHALVRNPERMLKVGAVALLVLWFLAHVPGVGYGTDGVPLHTAYIGDEQVSVNSALRVLNEKSVFAFRNREMQYYGPVLVMIDLPGVVLDFVNAYAHGRVHSAEEYKQYIIWDWGGIARNIRYTAVLAMMAGLVAVYLLVRTSSFTPKGNRYWPLLAAGLFAVNYYYFEWSHFSLHWAYIVPLLLMQWYTFVRIIETEGRVLSYWVLHGVATVLSFGISYFSAIFLAMWLPWFAAIAVGKQWASVRKFGCMLTGVFGGWLLIIAWHPYAFMRLLSFLGIGAPLHRQGSAVNPLDFTQTSFGFYGTELILNHLSIVIGIVVLLVVLRKYTPWRSPVLLGILMPGICNFLLFAPQDFPEGRYLLPTIVSLLLTCCFLLGQYLATPQVRTRLIHSVLIVLIAWYTLFHVVHDIRWIQIMAQGPAERTAIHEALELQKTGSPVLVIAEGAIWGYPHTKDAYHAFSEERGFGDIPLYKEIYAHPLPPDKTPLEVRYMLPDVYERDPAEVIRSWPHVILRYRSRTDRDWVAQTFFDENMILLWYFDAFSPTYLVLK